MLLARGQTPRRQRHAMEMDHGCRTRASQERAVGWLLAPERGMSNEILFEVGEAEKRIERLQTELAHLDAVLRMFRPNFKAEGLPVRHRRPTKSPYFMHGELSQRIFDALRVSGTVTSFEVAAQAMRDKGLDPENDKPT